MTPDLYCQEKVAIPGSTFYYSLLSLPAEPRRTLTALQALWQEVLEITGGEPGVAHARLDWWRAELNDLLAGRGQHPVSRALVEPLHRTPALRDALPRLLDAVAMDLDCDIYPSFEPLGLYCRHRGGALMLARAEILGYQDRRTLQFAQHLGVGLALTEILRDVYPAARRGHYYIPEDELQRFGVDHTDLRQRVTGDRLQALFRFQAERAGEQCRQALATLPAQDCYAQRSNRVLAEINLRLLEEIAADGFRLLEQRLSLTPLRKLWIAWRSGRRARRAR